MAESKLSIFKMSDLEVFQAIENITKDCGLPGAKCVLTLAKDHRQLQLNANSIQTEPTIVSLLKENSALIHQIRAHFDSWGATLRVDRTTGRADELNVQFPNEFDNGNAVKLLVAIRKHFRLFDAMENVERILGPEIADFYAKREEGLHRLEQLTGKIIEQNEDYRKKLELQHEERISKLEIQFNERRSLLEAELNKKNEEIAAKEAELVRRNQELDDRSSRHARRQLRQDFKKGIESRNLDFRLTPYTRHTRLPIHALFVGLVISFGVFSYIALWEQIHPPEGANPLYLLIRVPISIVAFAASVIYYIRWSDQWFQKHANEEFRLKRLDLDIDRASVVSLN
jgi:hypothetical protein